MLGRELCWKHFMRIGRSVNAAIVYLFLRREVAMAIICLPCLLYAVPSRQPSMPALRSLEDHCMRAAFCRVAARA